MSNSTNTQNHHTQPNSHSGTYNTPTSKEVSAIICGGVNDFINDNRRLVIFSRNGIITSKSVTRKVWGKV